MTRVGKILKVLRESSGKSQGEIAKKLNLTSPQYISNVERGVCPMSPKHFVFFADEFDIDVKKLINAHYKDYKERFEKEIYGSGKSKRV